MGMIHCQVRFIEFKVEEVVILFRESLFVTTRFGLFNGHAQNN